MTDNRARPLRASRTSRRSGGGSRLVLLLLSLILVGRLTYGRIHLLYGAETATLVAGAADSLILFLAAYIIVLGRGRRRHGRITAPTWLAMLLSGLFAIYTLHPEVYGTLLSLYGLRSATLPLLTVFVFLFVPLSRRQGKAIVIVLLSLLFANFLSGLDQAFYGLSPDEAAALRANGSTYLVDGNYRLSGLQGSGQEFALLTGGAAAFFIALGMEQGIRRLGVGIWLLALSAVLALSMTLQRGPIIGVGVAIVVALFMRVKQARSGPILATLSTLGFAVAAAAVLVAVVNPERVDAAIDSINSLTRLSTDDSFQIRRAETIPVSLHLMEQSLWGYGTGASGPPAAGRPHESPLYPIWLGGIAPDNGYIQTWLQIGLLGTVAFAALLLVWAVRGGLTTRGSSRVAVSSTIAFLSVSMLSGGYWGLTSGMAGLMALVALGERGLFVERKSPKPAPSRAAAHR